jgi:hypothetical protein
MACADRFIKDPARSAEYLIAPGSVVPRGSLDGFECRWRDIPSRHGETVSLMVRALIRRRPRQGHLRGGSSQPCATSTAATTSATPSARPRLHGKAAISPGAGVRASSRGAWQVAVEMRTRWFVVLGWFLMTFGIRTAKRTSATTRRRWCATGRTQVQRRPSANTAGTEDGAEPSMPGWTALPARRAGLGCTFRPRANDLPVFGSRPAPAFVDGATRAFPRPGIQEAGGAACGGPSPVE